MSSLSRFGVSLDRTLLKTFDAWLAGRGFASRSQAIAELIRDGLVEQEWKDTAGPVIGIVTLVYDPSHHVLSHTLTRTEHTHHERILSSQHIHLDERACLEVLVLKGRAEEIKRLAQRLCSLKGVKHGQMLMTTTGSTIA